MIFPLLRISGGKVVKEDGSVLAQDPVSFAEQFSIVGEFIVQDLDKENKQMILNLIKSGSSLWVKGITDPQEAVFWLNQGAAKILVEGRQGENISPEFLSALPQERVVVHLSGKEGKDSIQRLRAHAAGFLVDFDGGVNMETVKEWVEAAGKSARVTVAGVTSLDEIVQLGKLGADAQVEAPLYNGELDIGAAIVATLISDRPDGLFPTVVSDEQGVSLGLVYSSAESIKESIRLRRGVYYSRSRKSIWYKGETSGDTQRLVRIEVDCDRDALKFVVAQEGDGFCHLKSRSCFGPKDSGLGGLMRTLESRRVSAPQGSYTKRLFEDENLLRAKLVEEANELADAKTKDEVRGESADVIYFALVAAAKAGVTLADIERELDLRSLKVQRRPGNAKPHIVNLLQQQDQEKKEKEEREKDHTHTSTQATQKNEQHAEIDPTSFLRPDISKLELYTPIKPLEVLAEEIGLPVEKLIKLDANENLYGPIPEIKEAIANANLHIYPDPSQTYLRASLAKYTNLPVDCLIAGTGSDDLIDIIMRLVDPHTIMFSTPTFGMYSFLGKINKANILDVPRLPTTFELDYEGIAAALSRLDCPPNRVLMFFPSPNNPTGNPLSIPQVERLCSLGATIVVDEAYAEFCEETWTSAFSLIPRVPNLVVLRTFSKWAGLAGMRVGYGAAHPKLVEWLMAIKQPYNVSAAADVAARAALEFKDKVMVTVNLMKAEKFVLLEKLSRFTWLLPSPSSANFVLFRVTPPSPLSAAQIAFLLRKAGVLARYFSTPVLKDYVRISVGRPSDTGRLVEVLAGLENTWKILEDYVPQALIFDMDGVMADVSLSYRQAIIDTAKAFSSNVTHDDINEAKAAGNANNDWILTHRLISNFHSRAASGFPLPTLEDVTNKFEDIYQGVPGTPGLRELEKLLITLDEFEKFDSHLPLAIVTGRPRSDAVKFLQAHKIEHLFKHLVCMEDAPAKPSPEPVLLAMKKLGVERALMIGDTPDDVRAAVGAGIVGIGILSPGDKKRPDSVKIWSALVGAGAARVIDTVSELLSYCSRANQTSS